MKKIILIPSLFMGVFIARAQVVNTGEMTRIEALVQRLSSTEGHTK